MLQDVCKRVHLRCFVRREDSDDFCQQEPAALRVVGSSTARKLAGGSQDGTDTFMPGVVWPAGFDSGEAGSMCEQFVESEIGLITVPCIWQPVCNGPGKLFIRVTEKFKQQQRCEWFAGTSPWHESVNSQQFSGGGVSEARAEQRHAVYGHIDLQSGMQSPSHAFLEGSNKSGKSLQIGKHYIAGSVWLSLRRTRAVRV